MATDGVKIINGDLAHDTYWRIMDLYDSGVDIADIKNEIPFVRTEYGIEEDFYHEIFVTAYALAFWEIGGLSDDIMQEVQTVIKVGAGIKVWTEQKGVKEGKGRKKELDKLLKKISQPNLKVRLRKKYRKITKYHFQVDDLLTFRLQDNLYRAMICTSIHQYRGECNYMLTPTTYKSEIKPTVEDLYNYHILGITIGAGWDTATKIKMQPGIEMLWTLFPNEGEFFFGLVREAVDHKTFIEFKKKFEKVGVLRVKNSFKQHGTLAGISKFKDFESIFENVEQENQIRYNMFPVRLLCEL